MENSSVLTIIDKLLSEKVDFDIRISVKEGKGYVRCQLNSRKAWHLTKRVRVLVMYLIFIYSGDVSCPDGWFKSLNIHKNVQSNTSGERRMTPVITDDDRLAKKWKTADGAINYAKSLAKKLKTVTYRGNMLPSYRYLHSLDYSITVFDWDNKCNIFSIGMNKYTSSQSR